ncbi:MAG: endolytic transglycosylase MltG [Saprospiraceae bacterium]|nr:MAG: endolytic transglycosylase MltG [Saprospiraceae bacterium]
MDNKPDQPERPSRLRKILLTLVVVCMAATIFVGWNFFLKPNVPAHLDNEYVNIPTGSSLDDAASILGKGGFIINETSFRRMAAHMKYNGRAGRYKITPGWSNYRLVRHLRSGKQSPVKVVLVNERLPEDVAVKVARSIEADSLGLITLFHDPVFLDSIGLKPETLMSLFIPNTYEFFWNTTPRKFLERMLSENEKFWSINGRNAKALKLNKTHAQVYTLASIVERETNQISEQPRIAGLYLNRLRLGMPLQADPTLVFASQDWESRSLAQYKDLDSPYNTYKYPGLPPGPISMASIPTIDAVLNAEEHEYIFMCSLGDGTGFHSFAETYEAHKVNIERYKKNLEGRGL